MSFHQMKSWVAYHEKSSSHAQNHHRHGTMSQLHLQMTSQPHSSSRQNVSSHRNDYRVSSSSSQNRWHSVTNNKGNLVIAKKTTTSKAVSYARAEKKIRLLLTDYNKHLMDKKRDQQNYIDDLTDDIMKVCERYKRGGFNESDNESSTSAIVPRVPELQPKAKSPEKRPSKQTVPVQHNKPSSTITAKSKPKSKPKENKQIEPTKVPTKDTSNKSGKRMPNELMNLISSDGFVSTPPIRGKRTPKQVVRFNELDFESPRKRRRSLDRSAKKIDKKKPAPSNTTNAFKQLTTPYKAMGNASTSGDLLDTRRELPLKDHLIRFIFFIVIAAADQNVQSIYQHKVNFKSTSGKRFISKLFILYSNNSHNLLIFFFFSFIHSFDNSQSHQQHNSNNE